MTNATYDNPELYERLVTWTHGEEVRYGIRTECYITCPSCKHASSKKSPHFSFSRRGGKCFSCGYKARLESLAAKLGYRPDSTYQPRDDRPKRVFEPAPPRNWQKNPNAWVDRFTSAHDVMPQWQQYRPLLTLESIARWRLGVGVLPSCACKHKRLIYPVMVAGQVVALRGRSIACDCQKWAQSAGSQVVLFNEEAVTPGCVVAVVESPVDVMIWEQHPMPTRLPFIPVAGTAGAGTWKAEWTERLAAKRPAAFLVWLDNDLAGTPNEWTYRQLMAEWHAKHPTATTPPQQNGPKIATLLAATRIYTQCYQWPKGTPPKADYGWLLSQRKGSLSMKQKNKL
jgi:hypothetical protein